MFTPHTQQSFHHHINYKQWDQPTACSACVLALPAAGWVAPAWPLGMYGSYGASSGILTAVVVQRRGTCDGAIESVLEAKQKSQIEAQDSVLDGEVSLGMGYRQW
jgi:hypothetical protein